MTSVVEEYSALAVYSRGFNAVDGIPCNTQICTGSRKSRSSGEFGQLDAVSVYRGDGEIVSEIDRQTDRQTDRQIGR